METLRTSNFAVSSLERKHSLAPTSEGTGRGSVLGRAGEFWETGSPAAKSKISFSHAIFLSPVSPDRRSSQSTKDDNPHLRIRQEFFSPFVDYFRGRGKALTLKEKLTELVREFGGKQNIFAGRIGVSDKTVSTWFRKDREPDYEALKGIRRLGISIDWLVADEGNKYPPQPGSHDKKPAENERRIKPFWRTEDAPLLKRWRQLPEHRKAAILEQMDLYIEHEKKAQQAQPKKGRKSA